MAFELGSAHGAIVIDPAGVQKGVSEAEAVLNRLSDLGPSIADSLSDGFNEAEVNLLKMAEKISAVSEDTEVDLLKMAETATRAGNTIDTAAREGERALDKLAEAGPQVGEQIKKGADTAEMALKQVSDAGPGMADGIKRGADEAETAIKRVAQAGPTIADGIKSGVDKAEEHLGRLLNKATSIAADIGKKVALGLAAAGVALGAVGVTSVQTAADFESSIAIMSTAVDESAGSLEDLREAALAVGSDTSLVGVSASSAAEAITGLYKAGLDTTEIFGDMEGYLDGTAELSGALRASIDLAAASELDMVQASELAAVTLATFGGELETAEERAEFINQAMNNFVQTADASVAEVGDLAAALVNVGPVAAGLGLSLEETNQALGILSTRGIAGSEAGTALKSMLTNLLRDTPEVNAQLQGLGVNLYDVHGNLLPFPEILAQLEQALFGVGEKTLFVSNRTEEQNMQLDEASQEYARLQGIYDKAAQALNDYSIGVKGVGLTEEARSKKMAEQEAIMANAQAAMAGYAGQIADLESIGGETITVLSQLTEEQRNQAIQTLFGSYGQTAANALLAEGVEGWDELTKGIAEASTTQEVAAARTDTLAGSVEALQGVWEAFQIKLGTAAIPLLRDLADVGGVLIEKYGPVLEGAFTKVSDAIGIIVGALKEGGLSELFTTFEDGSSAIGAVLETFGMDEEKADAWGQAINNVAIAIGNIIAAVQEGGLTEVFTTFEDGSSVIGEFLEALGMEEGEADQLAQTINNTAIAVGKFIEKVGEFLEEHGWTLLKVLAGIAIAFKAFTIISTVVGWITSLMAIWGTLSAAITTAGSVIGGIVAVLGGPLTLVIAAVSALIGLLFVAWTENWGGIRDKVQAVIDFIKPYIENFIAGIKQWWAENGDEILAKAREIWDGIRDKVQTVVDTVSTIAQDAIAGIKQWWAEHGDEILAKVREIWGGIQEKIEAVKAIFQSLQEAFAAAREGDWFAFGEKLREAWDGLVKLFENADEEITTGIQNALKKVWEKIVNWWTNIDWGQIKESIREKVRQLDEAFLAIDWVGLAADLGRGLFGAIESLKENAKESILRVANAIWDAIRGFFGIKSPSTLMHGLGLDVIQGMINGVLEKAAGLWAKIKAPFESLWTDLKGWWDKVEWNKLPETIIEKVKTGLNNFWTGIKEKFDNVWTEITNFWNTLKDWAQLGRDVVEGIIGGLEEKGADIAATIKGYAEDAWEEIKEFFGIKSPSTLMFGAGIDVIQGLIDGIISIASNIWDFIKTPFDTLWESLMGWWEDTEWSQLAQDLMARLAESLGLWEALQANFDELYAAVLVWWQESDWEALAAETTTQVSNRLQYFWRDISGRFTQLYTALFASWFSVDWKSLGHAIIDGVIAGVNAKEAELTARMTAIARAAKAAAEQELGVASPSRVFIEIGEQIVAGLIIGIKSGIGPLQVVVSRQGEILRQYFEQVIADGQDTNKFLQQLPRDIQDPVRQIANLMLEGSTNISGYFQTVIATGDDMNEWLHKLPPQLQDPVQDIGEMIADGNRAVASYFSEVIRTGDAANDFLQDLPEQVQPVVESLGLMISDGSAAIRAYFDAVLEDGNYMNDWLQALPEEIRPAMVALGRMMSDATATVEQLLSTANRLGSIGAGVAGLFEENTLRPLQEEIDWFIDKIDDTFESLEDLEFEFMTLPEGFDELAGKEQLNLIKKYIAELERLPVLTEAQTAALNALRKAQEALNKQTADIDAMTATETRFRNKASKVEEWLRQIGPAMGDLRTQLVNMFLNPNEEHTLEERLEFIRGLPAAMRDALADYKNLTQDLNPLSADQLNLFNTLTSLTLPTWKDELMAALDLEATIADRVDSVEDAINDLLSLEGVSNVVQLPENFYDLPEPFRIDILRRIREELMKLKQVRPDFFELGAPHAQAISAIDSILLAMEKRNELQREYRLEEQRILELQKAQQDLQFLQQQLDLLKLIKENGLDTEQILGGIELGLGADKRGIIDAMVRAMQEMIKAAEEELQIASPSKVFERIGKLVNRGLALGIGDTRPITQAMRDVVGEMVVMGMGGGPQTSTTYANRTANMYGGQHIYNYGDRRGEPLEQLQPLLGPAF